MVGWHHRLNRHEFEQASGDGEGQGSLVCCSPWGHKRVGHGLPTKQHQQWYPLPNGVKKVEVFPTNSSFKETEFIDSWVNILDEFA